MQRTYQLAELRQNLSQAVTQVAEQQQPIYITRFGKVEAKLVPVSDQEIEQLAKRPEKVRQFWGLWKDREDIGDTQEFAGRLRERASRSTAGTKSNSARKR